MGFFKAYDMRGTFGVDFDLDTVYKVGLSLPRVVTPGVAAPPIPRIVCRSPMIWILYILSAPGRQQPTFSSCPLW